MSAALGNQLYRASAGTGKTHQLVQTYVQLVSGGCGPAGESERIAPREILLATFTRNAAAELRERVRRELDDRVFGVLLDRMHRQLRRDANEGGMDPGDGDELRAGFEAREGVEGAAICTLDSFCRRLVQERALELGVNPRMDLMDAAEEDELLRGVIQRELQSALDGDDATALRAALLGRRVDFSAAGGGFGGGSDLMNCLMGAVRKAGALGLIGADILAALPAQPVDGQGAEAIDDALDGLEACFSDPQVLTQKGILHNHVQGRHEKLMELRRQMARDGGVPELELLIGLRGLADRPIKKLQATPFYEILDRAMNVLAQRLLWPRGRALLGLLARVVDEFERLQRETGRYSFGLVQKLAVDALERPGVEGWKRFRYVIVDEAQDLSRMQARLLLGLWMPGRNHLILCGDEKQSIYGWRDAEPGVFGALGRMAVSDAGEERSLQCSYRSNGPMVDFINAYFSSVGFRLSAGDLVGLDYGTAGGPHWLLPGRARIGDGPVVEFWDNAPEAGAEAEKLKSPARRSLEVRALVRRIELLVAGRAGWVPEGGWDEERGDFAPMQGRGYRYRDICILLRRTTYQGMLEEGLRLAGIPFRVSHGRGFFTRQEVRDLWHWSRVLVDDHDEVALAGVLRSPLFGVSDQALQQLCRTSGLYEGWAEDEERAGGLPVSTRLALRGSLAALFRAPQLEREALDRVVDLQQRAVLFTAHACIRAYRELVDVLPPAGMLEQIIRERAFDAVLTGTFNGEQRLANLKKLLSWSRQWSRQRGGSLARFADELGDRIERSEQEPDAPLLDPEHDAVSIMTVHGSKGMTSRVVLLMDIDSSSKGGRNPWIWVGSRELEDSALRAPIPARIGLAAKLEWSGSPVPWLEYDALAAQEQRRDLLEQRNLLYVAMTRARDLMVVFSAAATQVKGKKSDGATSWDGIWRDYFDVCADRATHVRRGRMQELLAESAPLMDSREPGVGGAGIGPDGGWERAGRAFVSRPRVATTPTELNLLMSEGGVGAFIGRWWLGLPGLVKGELSGEQTGCLIEDAWERSDPWGPAIGVLAHSTLQRVRFSASVDGMRAELTTHSRRLAESPAEHERVTGFWENDRFLEWLSENPGRSVDSMREWEFACRLRLPEAVIDLRGAVDCMYRMRLDGAWRLVDYKFLRRVSPEARVRYRDQVLLYAYAARAQGLELETEATLVLVGADGSFCPESVSLTEADLGIWLQRVGDAAGALAHLRRGELPPGVALDR